MSSRRFHSSFFSSPFFFAFRSNGQKGKLWWPLTIIFSEERRLQSFCSLLFLDMKNWRSGGVGGAGWWKRESDLGSMRSLGKNDLGSTSNFFCLASTKKSDVIEYFSISSVSSALVVSFRSPSPSSPLISALSFSSATFPFLLSYSSHLSSSTSPSLTYQFSCFFSSSLPSSISESSPSLSLPSCSYYSYSLPHFYFMNSSTSCFSSTTPISSTVSCSFFSSPPTPTASSSSTCFSFSSSSSYCISSPVSFPVLPPRVKSPFTPLLGEVFRPIPHFDDLPKGGTFISNKGRIILPSGKLTFGHASAAGYRIVNICSKGYLMHRLVAETFMQKEKMRMKRIFGEASVLQVDHVNSQKDDNSVGNLQWLTQPLHARKTAQHRIPCKKPRLSSGTEVLVCRYLPSSFTFRRGTEKEVGEKKGGEQEKGKTIEEKEEEKKEEKCLSFPSITAVWRSFGIYIYSRGPRCFNSHSFILMSQLLKSKGWYIKTIGKANNMKGERFRIVDLAKFLAANSRQRIREEDDEEEMPKFDDDKGKRLSRPKTLMVSNFGRIRFPNGRVSFGSSGSIYRYVKVAEGQRIPVHRLVAFVWLKKERKKFEGAGLLVKDMRVIHKDGETMNNCADNLQWKPLLSLDPKKKKEQQEKRKVREKKGQDKKREEEKKMKEKEEKNAKKRLKEEERRKVEKEKNAKKRLKEEERRKVEKEKDETNNVEKEGEEGKKEN